MSNMPLRMLCCHAEHCGTILDGCRCAETRDFSTECGIDLINDIYADGGCNIPSDLSLENLQTVTSSAPNSETTTVSMPSPCGGNGEALPSTLYDVTLVSYNDDNYNGFFTQLDASQCFPRTTNGVVAQAEIIMTENP